MLDRAKELLTFAPLIVHYYNNFELLLADDASPYGLGVVFSHQISDSTKQPIAYASRSLTKSECRNSQLDKEVLSIVFAVTKFCQLLTESITTTNDTRRRARHPRHRTSLRVFASLTAKCY